jgi:hypothetical protein
MINGIFDFILSFCLGGVDKRVLYIDVMSGKIMKKYQAHAGKQKNTAELSSENINLMTSKVQRERLQKSDRIRDPPEFRMDRISR